MSHDYPISNNHVRITPNVSYGLSYLSENYLIQKKILAFYVLRIVTLVASYEIVTKLPDNKN